MRDPCLIKLERRKNLIKLSPGRFETGRLFGKGHKDQTVKDLEGNRFQPKRRPVKPRIHQPGREQAAIQIIGPGVIRTGKPPRVATLLKTNA